MQWFWCQLWNHTGSPIRVVIISNFGQGTYYINPGQYQWTQWYPGVKVLIAFDQWSGQLVTTYTFNVTGPVAHYVTQSNIPNVQGQQYTQQAPGASGAGPNH